MAEETIDDQVMASCTRHMIELASSSHRIMADFHATWKALPEADRTNWGADQAVQFFEDVIARIKQDPGSVMGIVFGMVQSNPEGHVSPLFHASVSGDPSITFMAGNALMQSSISRLQDKIRLVIEEETATHH